MRMTKMIREYITEEITKKYQPIIDATEAKYPSNKAEIEEVVEATRARLEEFAKTEFRNVLSVYYDQETVQRMLDDRNCTNRPSINWYTSRKDSKRETALKKIKDERDKTIRDTLITMELGGTKEQLDEMLANIHPEEV